MTSPVRVAVNGYGVIGKRVADAVRLQDDMVLAGVADILTDDRVQTAAELDVPLFAATEEALATMREANLGPAGTLDDLIAASDIVVDCTPKEIASQNRDRYVAAGRKAIFQGGERHALTGFSFVAGLNYADAVGRDLSGLSRAIRWRSAGSSGRSTGPVSCVPLARSSSGAVPIPGRAT